MSRTTHLIANNVPAPGFGPADSRSLSCSGVSRRVNAFSSGSSLCEHSLLTRVKFISHKRVSNAVSVLCGARPGNNRRNPDFSNSNRNWNKDRDNNDEGPDKSDYLGSKNGTMYSSTSSKYQANAAPGQKEKEIVELFRKIQPKLRKRTGGKDVSITRSLGDHFTGEGKDNEELHESIKNLLGPHFTGEGSKKIRASKNGSAASGQKATSRESRSWNLSNMKEIILSPEPEATPVNRPPSSFRRRSPVPSVKYQPIYNSEDGDNDQGEESESDEEFESEQDLEPEPISPPDDEYIFSDMAKGELSEEENSLDEDDQQPTEHEDLGSLKLVELRALAKSRGMKGFSKLKKSELLELLSGN